MPYEWRKGKGRERCFVLTFCFPPKAMEWMSFSFFLFLRRVVDASRKRMGKRQRRFHHIQRSYYLLLEHS